MSWRAIGRILLVSILLPLSTLSVLAESAETTTETDEAEESHQHRYIGGRVGYLEVDRVDAGSLNLGFMLGRSFASVFAIEGSVDFHTPEYDLADRSTYAFQASLYFYPFATLTRIQLYAVGGVGYYISKFEFDPTFNTDDESVSDGGYHAGFGIEFPL